MEITGWTAAEKSDRTGNWFCSLLGEKLLPQSGWSEQRVSAAFVMSCLGCLLLVLVLTIRAFPELFQALDHPQHHVLKLFFFLFSKRPALHEVMLPNAFFKSTSDNALKTFKFLLLLHLNKSWAVPDKSHPSCLKIHCFLYCNKTFTNACPRNTKFLKNNWEGTVFCLSQVNNQSSMPLWGHGWDTEFIL